MPNTVSLGMTVWEQLDEMWARPDPQGPRQPGWIWNPEDKVYDLRRISYLARERNRAMEPMWELEREKGIKFDKVLWLNDVVFDVRQPFQFVVRILCWQRKKKIKEQRNSHRVLTKCIPSDFADRRLSDAPLDQQRRLLRGL